MVSAASQQSPPSPQFPPSPQTPQSPQWYVENQQYLMAALGRVREILAQNSAPAIAPPLSPALDPPPVLLQLVQQLNLSGFERDLLLLCAGMELSDAFGLLCGEAQGMPGQRASPTFGLALAKLPQANWQAITPEAALRHWHLLEVGGGNTLVQSPLRIDERILHGLMGIQQTDKRLEGLLRPWQNRNVPLPDSYRAIASQISTLLKQPSSPSDFYSQDWEQGGHGSSGISPISPMIQLCGGDGLTKGAIALAACQTCGLNLLILAAEALPTDPGQLNLIQRLCEREALLTQSMVLVDCDFVATTQPEGNGAAAQVQSLISRFLETFRGAVMVSSGDRRSQRQRPLITFDIAPPTSQEQRDLWHRSLKAEHQISTAEIDRLVSHFTLSPPAIQTVCLQVNHLTLESSSRNGQQNNVQHNSVQNELVQHEFVQHELVDFPILESSDPKQELPTLLWQTCLSQSRPRLDELAQSIQSTMSWENLVLPATEFAVLKTIAAHVRQRAKVYEQWGFGGKNGRGLGISALFAGPSGTGKTLAAEVLANELHLDLYRIDLSTVVSKYIGETEKNLRRIFDAAEAGGAILLFDEADALFGKRSEVKDSHDRYANMEVAYLLQRIESYRGLAILTTNLKGSVDQAFLRRIRFIVQFPFPDAKQREEIWQRIFPQSTPLQDLSYKKLAKLSVAGGNIRNIALNAAFLAADQDKAVGMEHLLQASKAEYLKLERPLTDTEIRGWVSNDL